MDTVLINLVCGSCSKEYIVANGVQIENCIITHGGRIMHHLKTCHQKYENLGKEITKLEHFDVTTFLLEPSKNKNYKSTPLNFGCYIWKCQEVFNDLEKFLFTSLKCDFSHDENENIKLEDYLAYFIIIRTNLEKWKIPYFPPKNFQKGDEVIIVHTPYMCISLYNSWSKGVVSNFVGNTLILIDSRLTENCEGAPVFTFNNSEKGALIALVISNLLNDDDQGLTGFTVAVNLPIILKLYSKFHNLNENSSISKIFPETVDEMSIVKIVAGKIWGSGVIVSEDGVILTCAHAVHFNKDMNANILAKIGNKTYSCKVLFSTNDNMTLELAVLIIQNTHDKFKPISLSLRKAKYGEKVKAFGNHLIEDMEKPLVSSGIISKVTPYFLISSCLVHKGASGGALLDNDGKLIGIITYNLSINLIGKDAIIIPFINFCTATHSFGNYLIEFLVKRDILPLIQWRSSVPLDAVEVQPFRIEGISPLVGKL